MHGNVGEWCADGKRAYDSASQENPRGPEGDAPRVVRGGSWLDEAGGLRSACRDGGPRGSRLIVVGFRFSLRSNSQEAEQDQKQKAGAGRVTPARETGLRTLPASPRQTAGAVACSAGRAYGLGGAGKPPLISRRGPVVGLQRALSLGAPSSSSRS